MTDKLKVIENCLRSMAIIESYERREQVRDMGLDALRALQTTADAPTQADIVPAFQAVYGQPAAEPTAPAPSALPSTQALMAAALFASSMGLVSATANWAAAVHNHLGRNTNLETK